MIDATRLSVWARSPGPVESITSPGFFFDSSVDRFIICKPAYAREHVCGIQVGYSSRICRITAKPFKDWRKQSLWLAPATLGVGRSTELSKRSPTHRPTALRARHSTGDSGVHSISSRGWEAQGPTTTSGQSHGTSLGVRASTQPRARARDARLRSNPPPKTGKHSKCNINTISALNIGESFAVQNFRSRRAARNAYRNPRLKFITSDIATRGLMRSSETCKRSVITAIFWSTRRSGRNCRCIFGQNCPQSMFRFASLPRRSSSRKHPGRSGATSDVQRGTRTHPTCRSR